MTNPETPPLVQQENTATPLLSGEELKELQLLCDEATPGPWGVAYETCECDHACTCEMYPSELFSHTERVQQAWGAAERERVAVVANFTEADDVRGADAKLMAAARTALPKLLVENERLREALRTIAYFPGGLPGAAREIAENILGMWPLPTAPDNHGESTHE